jgi:hypothetical protein
MPFDAPMVREIVRRVLDHPDSDRSELACLPIGCARLPRMLCLGNRRPVSDSKRDVMDVHFVSLGTGTLEIVFVRVAHGVDGHSLGGFVIQRPL